MGFVFALNQSDGGYRWSNTTSNAVRGSPVVAYGTAYFPSSDGHLYAYNATDGTALWKFSATLVETDGTPAVADGKVFMGDDMGALRAIDAITGSEIWNSTIFYPTASAIAGGKVFTGSFDGYAYCLGPGLPTLFCRINGPASLLEGNTEQYTVTVTDSVTGSPVQGCAVGIAATGGVDVEPASGITGASGAISFNLTAPAAGGVVVQLLANATKAGYNPAEASASVAISALPSLVVNISADPVIVQSGGQSQVTVTVTSAENGQPIGAAGVLLSASSGSFDTAGGSTDPKGQITATYTAVFTSDVETVTINASAQKDGFRPSHAEAELTISPTLNATVYTNSTLLAEGGSVRVTVIVNDKSPSPALVPNATVAFDSTFGSIVPATAKTDASGFCTAVFKAPADIGLPLVVSEIWANATKSGFSSDSKSTMVTIVDNATKVLSVSVDAQPSEIPSGGESAVTVTVRGASGGELVSGAMVELSCDAVGAAFSAVTPSGPGKYYSKFTAPNVTAGVIIRITATAQKDGYSGIGGGQTSVIVTAENFKELVVAVAADPSSISTKESAEITVEVADESGNPVSGADIALFSSAGGNFDACVELPALPGTYQSAYHPPASGLKSVTNATIWANATKPNYIGNSSTAQVTINPTLNVAPAAAITNPSSGATVQGGYLIRGTASDADGFVAAVQVQIVPASGSPTEAGWANASGTTQWAFLWNTTSFSDGQYRICVRSFDGTDYSPVANLTVTVKNDADKPAGGIPGFEAAVALACVIVAFSLVTIAARLKGRRRQ